METKRDKPYAKLIYDLEDLPKFFIQGQGIYAYAELMTILMNYLEATGASWQLNAFLSLMRSDIIAAEARMADKGKPGPKRTFEKTAALACAAAAVTALKNMGRGVEESIRTVAKASKTIPAGELKKFRDSINRATSTAQAAKLYKLSPEDLSSKAVEEILGEVRIVGLIYTGKHMASNIAWEDL